MKTTLEITSDARSKPAKQRVVSVRFGALIFRGCDHHLDGANSSCARVRKETGEVLNPYEIWEVLQELARRKNGKLK